jgi:hypothetical protein
MTAGAQPLACLARGAAYLGLASERLQVLSHVGTAMLQRIRQHHDTRHWKIEVRRCNPGSFSTSPIRSATRFMAGLRRS